MCYFVQHHSNYTVVSMITEEVFLMHSDMSRKFRKIELVMI